MLATNVSVRYNCACSCWTELPVKWIWDQVCYMREFALWQIHHITSHHIRSKQFKLCSTVHSIRFLFYFFSTHSANNWQFDRLINCECGHVSNSRLGTENWQLASGKLYEIICSFSTDKKLSKNFKCFDDGDLEVARTFDRKGKAPSYRASDRNYIHKIWLVVLFGKLRAWSLLLELMPPIRTAWAVPMR